MIDSIIKHASHKQRGYPIPLLWIIAVLLMGVNVSFGQNVFDSGSTGEDGALVFFTPPDPRIDFAMVYDEERDVVVAFGGHWAGNNYFSTWEWDGTIWRERTDLPNSPTARMGHAMAYDSNRNVVVLFGGRTTTAANTRTDETWEYDGTNWTQMEPVNKPSARFDHGLAFDSSRNRIILFGGNDGNLENDTWEYDGTTWTQTAPASSPIARDRLSLVYDTARNVTVLFGGWNGSFGRMNDTWEFNGTTWNQISTANAPSGRISTAISYDSNRQRIVLFGGDISGNDNQIWEYDGLNWSRQTPENNPPSMARHALAYDSDRQQTVLFGGLAGSTYYNETWLWDGTNWNAPQNIQPNPVIDMAERPNGVWNYTTIHIPSKVRLSFRKNAANSPVVWLATGDVVIDGVITLNGSNGMNNVDPGNEAPGGPGGFAGGRGGKRQDVSGSFSGVPGQGPGGGQPGTAASQRGGDAGYFTAGSGELGGSVYGNRLLVPILGGSGGGGGGSSATNDGGSGGGGGGAFLCASSGNIRINGSIEAIGGTASSIASTGGRGSGGGVRLVANRIEGNGSVDAQPNGRIRMEGFYVQVTGQVRPTHSSGPPIAVNLGDQGSIRITQIAGQVVPLDPTGDTNSPDVIFTEAGDITVSIATVNIPQDTVLTVRVTAEGQVLTVETQPVDADGNTNATLTVPAGVGTIQAYAQYVVQ